MRPLTALLTFLLRRLLGEIVGRGWRTTRALRMNTHARVDRFPTNGAAPRLVAALFVHQLSREFRCDWNHSILLFQTTICQLLLMYRAKFSRPPGNVSFASRELRSVPTTTADSRWQSLSLVDQYDGAWRRQSRSLLATAFMTSVRTTLKLCHWRFV